MEVSAQNPRKENPCPTFQLTFSTSSQQLSDFCRRCLHGDLSEWNWNRRWKTRR